jgi:pyrroline-5-carboxylate reductase
MGFWFTDELQNNRIANGRFTHVKDLLMDQVRVLLIGVGNMGGALAQGLTDCKETYFSITLHDTHPQRLVEMGRSLNCKTADSLVDLALDFEAIILAVKPQDFPTVAGFLRGRIPQKTLLVSILAGITITDLSEQCQHEGAVVRAMPNIAGIIHAAATALSANSQITPDQRSIALGIFNAIGEADWTKESLMDAVTGLSGSGPAYVYMVIEALTDGGVKMGIPRQLSAKLATQTVLGAAQLVKTTKQHPAVLKEQVTTPGGTTINAIHELEDRGLRAMLISAVETATLRSAFLRTQKKNS